VPARANRPGTHVRRQDGKQRGRLPSLCAQWSTSKRCDDIPIIALTTPKAREYRPLLSASAKEKADIWVAMPSWICLNSPLPAREGRRDQKASARLQRAVDGSTSQIPAPTPVNRRTSGQLTATPGPHPHLESCAIRAAPQNWVDIAPNVCLAWIVGLPSGGPLRLLMGCWRL
jgi:hypothetical protein